MQFYQVFDTCKTANLSMEVLEIRKSDGRGDNPLQITLRFRVGLFLIVVPTEKFNWDVLFLLYQGATSQFIE